MMYLLLTVLVLNDGGRVGPFVAPQRFQDYDSCYQAIFREENKAALKELIAHVNAHIAPARVAAVGNYCEQEQPPGKDV